MAKNRNRNKPQSSEALEESFTQSEALPTEEQTEVTAQPAQEEPSSDAVSVEATDAVSETEVTEETAVPEVTEPVVTPTTPAPVNVSKGVEDKSAKGTESVQATFRPANLSGRNIKLYDALGSAGKQAFNIIYDYLDQMAPGRPMDAARGARYQASFYQSMIGVLSLPHPEFDTAMELLMETFKDFRKTTLSDRYALRFSASIPLSRPDRDLWMKLVTAFVQLCDGKTRRTVFAQFDQTLAKALTEGTKGTRLSNKAPENVLAYFRR